MTETNDRAITVWECTGCGNLHEDPEGLITLYTCQTDGGLSPERTCETCHKFMSKETEQGCPDCEAAECEDVTRYRCPEYPACDELFEDDEHARDHCLPPRVQDMEEIVALCGKVDHLLAEVASMRAERTAGRPRSTVWFEEWMGPRAEEHIEFLPEGAYVKFCAKGPARLVGAPIFSVRLKGGHLEVSTDGIEGLWPVAWAANVLHIYGLDHHDVERLVKEGLEG